MDIRIGNLLFHSIDVDGRESVAADLPPERRRGIYLYRFADGKWYVGKSENVVARYVQHRHEFRHSAGRPTVQTMWFAEIPGSDAAELDEAETLAIATLEEQGYDLTNLMKTKTPGGHDEIVVTETPCAGVRLPWNRSERPRKSSATAIRLETSAREDEKLERYEELSSLDCWPQLRRLLSEYIDETIPAPNATSGILWVATALPSPSSKALRRLVTISCGNVETLAVFSSQEGIFGFVNAREDEQGNLQLTQAWRENRAERVSYGSAKDVTRVWFDGLNDLAGLLENEEILDCSYRLNVEMMRKGPTMYRRFCNNRLIDAMLSES